MRATCIFILIWAAKARDFFPVRGTLSVWGDYLCDHHVVPFTSVKCSERQPNGTACRVYELAFRAYEKNTHASDIECWSTGKSGVGVHSSQAVWECASAWGDIFEDLTLECGLVELEVSTREPTEPCSLIDDFCAVHATPAHDLPGIAKDAYTRHRNLTITMGFVILVMGIWGMHMISTIIYQQSTMGKRQV